MFYVFNNTDGFYAAPEPFKTREEAEAFIKHFKTERFKHQGYYFTSDMKRIDPADVDLRIEEGD
jgi:hypothetical protein